jgi:hypothetical protein
MAVFARIRHRYNAVNSAIVEMLEYLRHENVKVLVGQVAEKCVPHRALRLCAIVPFATLLSLVCACRYADVFCHLTYVSTFQDFLRRHDQTTDFLENHDPSLFGGR